MSGSSILRNTQRQRDLVDLSLCLTLFKLSNGRQFESMEESTFVNFLNLRAPLSIIVRKKKKTRICYLIHPIAGESQGRRPPSSQSAISWSCCSICLMAVSYWVFSTAKTPRIPMKSSMDSCHNKSSMRPFSWMK